MFKIIPHLMTLLIAFPLQVIVLYFILHHLLLLPYCFMTYPLPSSYIPSPRICHICCLHPLCLSIKRSSPPLVLSHINLCLSSELLSCILVTLFILVFISCPHFHQNHQLLLLSDTSTLPYCLSDYTFVICIIPAL
jgi:hypothetical protein